MLFDHVLMCWPNSFQKLRSCSMYSWYGASWIPYRVMAGATLRYPTPAASHPNRQMIREVAELRVQEETINVRQNTWARNRQARQK